LSPKEKQRNLNQQQPIVVSTSSSTKQPIVDYLPHTIILLEATTISTPSRVQKPALFNT
jgi:hypothetical protein